MRLADTPDGRFMAVVAMAAAAIVFIGFAPTYYLRGLFGGPPLDGLLHVHGLVTTLWFVLLIVQIRLVSASRMSLHRRLGAIGAVLAALVVLMGFVTVTVVAKRGFSSDRPPAPIFVAMIGGNLVVFAVLVAAGYARRRQGSYHKRYMVLASLSMLVPAIGRIPLQAFQAGGFATAFAWTDLVIAACVAYDTWRNKTLHPAFAWGAIFVVISQAIRFPLARAAFWQAFVGRMAR